MSEQTYGQQREMEDPTMIGTLQAQAEMIWPIERPLLDRLQLEQCSNLADLGCGTAQFAGRVAEEWPNLEVSGLDLFEGHLRVAREQWPADRSPNLHLEQGDARRCPWTNMSFDVVALRHFLHAIPDPAAVLKETRRILKPGGKVYVVAEDYQGLIFDAGSDAAAQLFNEARPNILEKGTDLHHGRAAYRLLVKAGFTDVQVAPIYIDTLNTPRDVFARMLRYWRDGYTRFVSSALQVPAPQVKARFDDLILTVMDSDRYACWLLFAVFGTQPQL